MKRFVSFFMAVVVVILFSSSNAAEAADVKKFLRTTEELRKEYVLQQNHVDFRDFDFLLKIAFVEIKAWDSTLKNKKTTVEKKMEASKQYIAIIASHYITMDKYLELVVIPNDTKPNKAQKKCAKMRRLLAEGIRALK